MAQLPWYRRKALHFLIAFPLGTAGLLLVGRTGLGFIGLCLASAAIGVGIGLVEDELGQ